MTRYPELFPKPPFLEEKLGREIFDHIPQKPGIYRFFDANGNLLYVGKSKNLRKRLFSYKTKRAGNTSRKESRLISKIAFIEYDVHKSEHDALLAENRLIRLERPSLNHANKQTEAYYFIRMRKTSSGIHLSLSMNSSNIRNPSINELPVFWKNSQCEKKPEDTSCEPADSKLYGCFKGHNTVRRSFGALLQLLWFANHKTEKACQLPVMLTRNLAPLNFKISISAHFPVNPEELFVLLDSWFLGKSDQLISLFDDSAPAAGLFSKMYHQERLETLRTFYIRSLKKHHQIRCEILQDEFGIIPQDKLDDLMILYEL